MAKAMKNTEQTNAWNAFAKYIRIKGCLDTTGSPFAGICITCGNQFHIDYLDAGHCFSGRHNARLFSERFVNIQCRVCNRTHNGRSKRYRRIMVEKYGEESVDRYYQRTNKVVQDVNVDWQGRIKRYKRKYIKLMEQNGFKTWSQLLQMGK